MKSYVTLLLLCLLVMMFFFITPVHASKIAPVYIERFEYQNFTASGWNTFTSGSGEFTAAMPQVKIIPQEPGFAEDSGMTINASRGEGSAVMGPVVDIGNNPAVIEVNIHSTAGGGIVSVGALDATLGGTLDTITGSVTYATEIDSAVYSDGYTKVSFLYKPKNMALVPVLQLAVPGNANVNTVEVSFDNLKVYVLDQNSVTDPDLQSILGIKVATNPTATPTPTVTPTPTPTIVSDVPFVNDFLYTLTDDQDSDEAAHPSIAFDQQDTFALVYHEVENGFQDIYMTSVEADSGSIGDSFTINDLREDTRSKNPDLDINYAGDRFAVWVDNRSLVKLDSVYLTITDSFGSQYFDDDIEVNDLFEDTNTSSPAISVNDQNNVGITWIDDRAFFDDLYARRYQWDGRNITLIDPLDFQVNKTFEDTNVTDPTALMRDNGDMVVVWSDNRFILESQKKNDIFARIIRPNDRANEDRVLPDTVPEVHVSAFDSIFDHATQPQIAASQDRYVIIWKNTEPELNNSSSIFGAVLDFNGQHLQTEFIIDGNENTKNASPAIAHIEDNIFQISWYDQNTDEILMVLYDAFEHAFVTNGYVVDDQMATTENLQLAVNNDYQYMAVWDNQVRSLRDIFGVSGQVFFNNLIAKTTPKSPSFKGVTPMGMSLLQKKPARNNMRFKEKRESKNISPKR